jgi:hypothetical protein
MSTLGKHFAATHAHGQEIICTNCKVPYSGPADGSHTHTVCPVCNNRQPYGWTQPQNCKPLAAIKQHLFCKSRFSEVGHLASMFR